MGKYFLNLFKFEQEETEYKQFMGNNNIMTDSFGGLINDLQVFLELSFQKDETSLHEWINETVRQLREFIIALIHSLRLKQQEVKEALHEVKVLSGLLPICSSCKKVRDDKGYRNQIESYVL